MVVATHQNMIYALMNSEQTIETNVDKFNETGKNSDGTKNEFRCACKDMKRQGYVGLLLKGAKDV